MPVKLKHMKPFLYKEYVPKANDYGWKLVRKNLGKLEWFALPVLHGNN